MSQSRQKIDDAVFTEWFPEPLSDEAVYSIHLFLQAFTYQFEGTYYAQIKRHFEAEKSAKYIPDTPSVDDIDF